MPIRKTRSNIVKELMNAYKIHMGFYQAALQENKIEERFFHNGALVGISNSLYFANEIDEATWYKMRGVKKPAEAG